jgi:hypothetical protein
MDSGDPIDPLPIVHRLAQDGADKRHVAIRRCVTALGPDLVRAALQQDARYLVKAQVPMAPVEAHELSTRHQPTAKRVRQYEDPVRL